MVRDLVYLPVNFVNGSVERWAADQLETRESAYFRAERLGGNGHTVATAHACSGCQYIM